MILGYEHPSNLITTQTLTSDLKSSGHTHLQLFIALEPPLSVLPPIKDQVRNKSVFLACITLDTKHICSSVKLMVNNIQIFTIFIQYSHHSLGLPSSHSPFSCLPPPSLPSSLLSSLSLPPSPLSLTLMKTLTCCSRPVCG